jgi:hypothetical protein
MLSCSSSWTPRSRTTFFGLTTSVPILTVRLRPDSLLRFDLEPNQIKSDLAPFSCSRREAHYVAMSLQQLVSFCRRTSTLLVLSVAYNCHGKQMVFDIMALKDVTAIFSVADEFGRAQNRTLLYAAYNRRGCSEITGIRQGLSSTCEVRLEPVKYRVSHTEPFAE